MNFVILGAVSIARKTTEFIYRANFRIHMKISGITLIMNSPKIVDLQKNASDSKFENSRNSP